MMRRSVLLCLFAISTLFGQQAAVTTPVHAAPQHSRHKVELTNTYHRLICIVPIVGAGTPTDPRRPAYAPLPTATGKALPRSGIVAFGFVHSDDKKFAIVEFVAADPAAFKAILADKSVVVFDKGKAKRPDIEAQAQNVRKGFTLDQLRVMAP